MTPTQYSVVTIDPHGSRKKSIINDEKENIKVLVHVAENYILNKIFFLYTAYKESVDFYLFFNTLHHLYISYLYTN